MAMTETQRTTLYSQLTDAIGQEAAKTLMEQLPPSGWDQVATKDDVKASEQRLQRDIEAREKRLQGQLKESEGRLILAIAASESRQGARIDETNTRIDGTNASIHGTNARIDETNTRIDGTNASIHGTNARIDETNTRIDGVNARIDDTNRELSELTGEVKTGFAGLQLTLARHTRWMAAVLLGFAVSMAVPLTIALL